jgi:hypothetical protein
MSLKMDQLSFATALLDPDLPVPSEISPGGSIAAEHRFAIYRNNVVSGLVSALETAFPTVLKIVGEEFFKAMGAVFVRQHPPKSPIMMLYGDDFSGFLRSFEPVANIPYLADVAALEQLRRRVYHAADNECEALPSDFLSRFRPEELPRLVFTLAPATAAANFEFPALSLWHWNNTDEDTKPSLPAEGEDVLIWREGNQIKTRLLTPGSAVFLESLKNGVTFGESAEVSSKTEGFDLATTISALIETRLTIAIKCVE